MNIIPTTMVDAFAKGNILQVLLVAILFGFALALVGPKCKPVVELFEALTHAVFGVINILMKLAPIGAFGAMAFTVGRYGIASLGPLGELIVVFYGTCFLFVLVVFGLIAWAAGFNIIKFLYYILDEIILVLATSSSDPALPTLMAKMEKLGCSKSLVGLVVPTGYTFNTDGSSLYMTMAALFVAQATNIHLTVGPAVDDLRRGCAYVQGSERRNRRGVHRARRHADGHSHHPSRRHGVAHRHRSLYEHGSRGGEYDWKRRGNRRRRAVGARTRQGDPAEESGVMAASKFPPPEDT